MRAPTLHAPTVRGLALVAFALAAAMPAAAQVPTGMMGPLRPDQQRFLGLYKELVETDTTLSAGDCTRAARQIRDRLKSAGMRDEQLTLFVPPGHPREGGLVAVLPGTSSTARPILLLAHIDVVEARRADWQRDPFTLVDEGGYYYARGSADDKSMAAIWADLLVRLASEKARPKRSIKVALTCGEESDDAVNGARWLAANRRALIDAEFGLNEGGGGRTDGKGRLLVQTVQVGEKTYQDYQLTVTNPGGHSSAPVRDNAITTMAGALTRVGALAFPIEFNPVTRAYFQRMSAMRTDAIGAAMRRLVANPADAEAEAIVNGDKLLNAQLRTTCVATLVDGGHAPNALPQRVTANVNCRIFPGHSPAGIQAALARAIGDPKVVITPVTKSKPLAKTPPLDPRVIGPMERLAAKYFPGVPLVPAQSNGATDSPYFAAVGIPMYGTPGGWSDPDGNGTHGLNERIEKRALFTARDYLTDLVRAYAF